MLITKSILDGFVPFSCYDKNMEQLESNKNSTAGLKWPHRIRITLVISCFLAFLAVLIECSRLVLRLNSEIISLVGLLVWLSIFAFAFIVFSLIQLLSARKMSATVLRNSLNKASTRETILLALCLIIVPLYFIVISFDLCVDTCEEANSKAVSQLLALLAFIIMPIIIKIMIKKAKRELESKSSAATET